MRKKNAKLPKLTKHRAGSGESHNLHSRRNRGSEVNAERVRAGRKRSEREFSLDRKDEDGNSRSILGRAIDEGTREVGSRAEESSHEEVKKIAEKLPRAWGNHRFVWIMLVLILISSTVGIQFVRTLLKDEITVAPVEWWVSYFDKYQHKASKERHKIIQLNKRILSELRRYHGKVGEVPNRFQDYTWSDNSNCWCRGHGGEWHYGLSE